MKVSRLCLGTVNLECQAGEQRCFRMMDEALDIGINFLDTDGLSSRKILNYCNGTLKVCKPTTAKSSRITTSSNASKNAALTSANRQCQYRIGMAVEQSRRHHHNSRFPGSRATKGE